MAKAGTQNPRNCAPHYVAGNELTNIHAIGQRAEQINYGGNSDNLVVPAAARGKDGEKFPLPRYLREPKNALLPTTMQAAGSWVAVWQGDWLDEDGNTVVLRGVLKEDDKFAPFWSYGFSRDGLVT